MKKLSVIIPTLQRDTDILQKLISTLDKDESVGEIIVIDNSLKGLETDSSKMKLIIPKENLFVNPSWNLGIEHMKFDYFALFNDDVLIPENFCSKILPTLSEKKGIFGMDGRYVENIDETVHLTIGTDCEPIFEKVSNWEINFGIIMFGHKNAYFEIPEELLIYCGDLFLVDLNKLNKRQNYLIKGLKVLHAHSLTSGMPIFNKIKDEDDMKYTHSIKKYLRKVKLRLPWYKKLLYCSKCYTLTERIRMSCIMGFNIVSSRPLKF